MQSIDLSIQDQLMANRIFDVFSQIPNLAENILVEYSRGRSALDGVGAINKPLTTQQLQQIKFNKTKINDSNGFKLSITAESKDLATIQNGKTIEPYDMKDSYPYGKKSRSKNGVPYLIIPFRWGTPNENGNKRAHFANFIPQANYQLNVSKMQITRRLSTTPAERNYNGDNIQRAEYGYKVGDKIKRGFAESLKDSDAFGDISQFTGLHYSAGMVRMKSNTGTNYFSFRIITPFQHKDMWVRKGKTIPAVDIESAWARTLRNTVLNMVK